MANTTPAAATHLIKSLHNLDKLLHDSTGTMQALQVTPAGRARGLQLMLGHIIELQQIVDGFHSFYGEGFHEGDDDWPVLWMTAGAPAAARLYTVNTQCVSSFGAVISAATAAMQRLNIEADPPRPSRNARRDASREDQHRLVGLILIFIGDACEWVSSWTPYEFSANKINLTPLQAPLNEFMGLLLRFIQQSGFTYRSLPQVMKMTHVWQEAAHKCLDTVILLLRVKYDSSPADACLLMQSLLPGFLAKMCCLACEIAPRPKGPGERPYCTEDPGVEAYSQILHSLQHILGSCVSSHISMCKPFDLNPELVCKASMEVVKRAVCFSHTTRGVKLDFLASAQHSLSKMLHAFHQISINRAGSSSGNSGSVNIIPTSLTSDQHMLSILAQCSQLQHDPQQLHSVLSTVGMKSIVNLWCELGTPVFGLQPHAVHSLPLVVRHCSLQLCRNMQHHRDLKHTGIGPQGRTTPAPAIIKEATLLMQLLHETMGLYLNAWMLNDETRTVLLTAEQMETNTSMRSSPAWERLGDWQRLPGSSAVLEMLVRGKLSCTSALVPAAVTSMIQIVLVNIDVRVTSSPPNDTDLSTHISMLASVHKLLLLYTSASDYCQAKSRTPTQALELGQRISQIRKLLCNALKAVQTAMLLAQANQESLSIFQKPEVAHLSSAGVKTDGAGINVPESCNSNLSTSNKRASNGIKGVGGGGSGNTGSCSSSIKGSMSSSSGSGGGSSSGGGNSSKNKGTEIYTHTSEGCSTPDRSHPSLCEYIKRGLHQLHAVQIMVLLWLGNLQVRLKSEQGQEEEGCGPNPTEEWGLGAWFEVHDAELASIVRELVLPPQHKHWLTQQAQFQHEATVWDEYAMRHFHGRLLPGCSYLHCTNMSGTSEQSLDTLLCSGCRRTRYCSVACQRAAWVKGGHAKVCGKGA